MSQRGVVFAGGAVVARLWRGFAPSPLQGEGWDEGRVLRRPSLDLAFWCWLGREVARLRRAFVRLPAPELLLFAGHATAGSGGERRSRPEGRRVGCPESREVAKRNGLWSPPTLQVLTVDGSWNRRDTSCSTNGHTAPSPLTEGGAGGRGSPRLACSSVAENVTESLHSCPTLYSPSPSFPRKRESSGGLVRSTRNRCSASPGDACGEEGVGACMVPARLRHNRLMIPGHSISLRRLA
jgi:hypothetical protein